MKHLAKIAGGLIAMLLLFGSVQAWAAGTTQDREFNHMSTGFPLAGVHATTSCESCHVGGVFVGTPRACDGCHATGKRIVATPKSTKHIVTDAPCETCHFNTSTFFGARYNHGTAVPGQCENCHNGRITQGKPTSHPVTIYSCDNCHRSSSWLPASWNHRDTVSDCSTCHKVGGPGRYISNMLTHPAMSMGATPPVTFTANCRACHNNYYTFLSAFYNHSGAGSACQECHGGSLAGAVVVTGVLSAKTTGVQAIHNAINATAPFATATCQSCHLGYATFLGARYNHSGAAATGCPTCHVSPASNYGGYLQLMNTAAGTVHAVAVKGTVGIITGAGAASTGCASCHSLTNYSTWAGARYLHNDAAYTATAGNCTACHVAGNAPLKVVPSSHSGALPALSNPGCLSCHGTSVWGTRMNHAIIGAVPCKQCHDSGLNTGAYFTGMEKKSNGHKGYNQATQDCISCHANQYNRWNHP